MKWTKWMLALAIGTAAACGGQEEDRSQAQAAAEEVAAELGEVADEVAEQAVAEAQAAAAQGGEATQAGANTAPSPSAMQDLAQLGEALGAALQAGAQAEGDNPCEQAFNGAVAMLQVVNKQLRAGNEMNLPDREAFMEACTRLPEEAQRCMVPAYAMQHMQECREAQSDPRVQAIREMMRAGGALPN